VSMPSAATATAAAPHVRHLAERDEIAAVVTMDLIDGRASLGFEARELGM
jgi:hypothetical protein